MAHVRGRVDLYLKNDYKQDTVCAAHNNIQMNRLSCYRTRVSLIKPIGLLELVRQSRRTRSKSNSPRTTKYLCSEKSTPNY